MAYFLGKSVKDDRIFWICLQLWVMRGGMEVGNLVMELLYRNVKIFGFIIVKKTCKTNKI